jgi:Family of unknown function (DUF6152)
VEVFAMNSRLFGILMLPFGLFAAVVPAAAHHAFAGQFDINKPITIMGTVTKIEWMNPHIYFYIDVKDNSGKVANWMIEGGSPNGLLRAGWTRNSLKPGMEVNVEGYLAKDGSNLANMTAVTMAGKKVLGRIDSPGDPK